MRKIRAEAARAEFETCENEHHALAREMECIQSLRPRWNVAGAFSFLYPMLGVCSREGYFYLCYTLEPEPYAAYRLHGAYRSRERTREAFFALSELLRLIGHPLSKAQVAKSGLRPSPRGYVYGFRQIDPAWQAKLDAFFAGEDFGAIETLALQLLERPTAVARSHETQERLHAIRRFWKHEATALKEARACAKWTEYPVAQKDRDFLFIALRSGGLFVPTPRR